MIYIDNNATTKLDESALRAMEPYWLDAFANPSSPYTLARRSAAAVEAARHQVARLIGVGPSTISFTGGGTEANAGVILGALAAQPTRRGIVISAVEHACVHETAWALAGKGWRVEEIPVARDGVLDLAAARRLIGRDTALVSVMLANNETGAIHPIARIAELAKGAGALMHCDAVQAAGKIPVDVAALGVDMLSLCAHKLHGPKGVGAFHLREGLPFEPPVRGGDQEGGRRAGTENVPGIVGFGAAAAAALCALRESGGRLVEMRRRMESRVVQELAGVECVASAGERLPNTSLFLIEGVGSEALLARLDLDGFCVSSGSACASGAAEPSRVLRAMGLARAGWGALRVSTCRFNTDEEMDCLVGALIRIVKNLREVVR
jgi:cysteine desulfurase